MSLAHPNAPFEEAIIYVWERTNIPFQVCLKEKLQCRFGLVQTSVPISGDVPAVNQLPDWDFITEKTCKYSH